MRRNRDYAIEVDFFSTEPIESSMSFKQYDYGTSEIRFSLFSKGEILQLEEDEEIIIVFKCKNNITAERVEKTVRLVSGEDVLYPKTLITNILNEDGTVTTYIPKQVMKNQGTTHCELVIINKVNGNRKTSPDISFTIVKSLVDVDFESLIGG